jgi:hypothetical protein
MKLELIIKFNIKNKNMRYKIIIIFVLFSLRMFSQCDFISNQETQTKCLDFSNNQYTYWSSDYYFSTNQNNLTYQWYLNGNQLQSGSVSGEYSGVTSLNSFSIYGSVSPTLIGSTYYCVIRDASNCLDTAYLVLGGDPTDEFGVTNFTANSIVGQTSIQSQPIVVNQANVDFQWLFWNTNLTDNGHYIGTNSDQLTISNIVSSDEGSYLCLVSSSLGCTDSINFNLQVCENYEITQQPSDIYGSLGQNVNFYIGANNVISYSWEGNFGFGFQSLSNAGQFSGTNTNTLNVQNISSSNNNSLFRCKILNADGCDQPYMYSDTATLFIQTNNVLENTKNNLTFYPNPTNGKLHFYNNESIILKVFLYSFDGKLLREYINTDNNEIDISEFPKGTYYLNANSFYYKIVLN